MRLSKLKVQFIVLLLLVILLAPNVWASPKDQLELPASEPSDSTEIVDDEIDEMLSMELEDLLVYVASKKEEKIQDAPGIITIITKEEIQAYGGNFLYHIFERLPNTLILGNTNVTGPVAINIRGQTQSVASPHTLLLLNGRPLFEDIFSGFNIAVLGGLAIESIECIEIIRGPGSALYGTGAFSGVANIITIDPSQASPIKVTTGYGSNNTFFASGVGTQQYEDLSFLVAGKYFDTDGWFVSERTSAGDAFSADISEDDSGIYFQSKFKNFSLQAFAGRSAQTTLGVGTAKVASQNLESNRRFLDLQYEHEISNDLKGVFNITYNGHDLANTAGTVFGTDEIIYEPAVSGTLLPNLNFLMGFRVRQLHNVVSENSTLLFNYGYYAQTDYTFKNILKLESLKFIGGIQLNKPEGSDLNTSLRAGMIANMDSNWGMKLLFGEAFRNASATEKFIDTTGFTGNPTLAPETIKTYDAQILYNSASFKTSFTYYNSTLNNSIEAAASTFINVEKLESEGVEWEFNYDTSPNLELTGSISHQTNQNSDGTKNSTPFPNFMAKLGASWSSPLGTI